MGVSGKPTLSRKYPTGFLGCQILFSNLSQRQFHRKKFCQWIFFLQNHKNKNKVQEGEDVTEIMK